MSVRSECVRVSECVKSECVKSVCMCESVRVSL